MSPASESILSQAFRFENLREADCQFGLVCDERILDIYRRATVIAVGFSPCGVENRDVLATHRNVVLDLALHALMRSSGERISTISSGGVTNTCSSGSCLYTHTS